MPRYFFHTKDGEAHQDDNGTELAGLLEARVHAIRYAGEVMANEPGVLWDGQEFLVEVSDANNTLLFIVACNVQNAPASGNTK